MTWGETDVWTSKKTVLLDAIILKSLNTPDSEIINIVIWNWQRHSLPNPKEAVSSQHLDLLLYNVQQPLQSPYIHWSTFILMLGYRIFYYWSSNVEKCKQRYSSSWAFSLFRTGTMNSKRMNWFLQGDTTTMWPQHDTGTNDAAMQAIYCRYTPALEFHCCINRISLMSAAYSYAFFFWSKCACAKHMGVKRISHLLREPYPDFQTWVKKVPEWRTKPALATA